jgi:hypothetical protein
MMKRIHVELFARSSFCGEAVLFSVFRELDSVISCRLEGLAKIKLRFRPTRIWRPDAVRTKQTPLIEWPEA